MSGFLLALCTAISTPGRALPAEQPRTAGGAKGARLKKVGSRARHQIEALLGTKVYLDLRIKVAKDWQRDPRQLRRLGFYD